MREMPGCLGSPQRLMVRRASGTNPDGMPRGWCESTETKPGKSTATRSAALCLGAAVCLSMLVRWPMFKPSKRPDENDKKQLQGSAMTHSAESWNFSHRPHKAKDPHSRVRCLADIQPERINWLWLATLPLEAGSWYWRPRTWQKHADV